MDATSCYPRGNEPRGTCKGDNTCSVEGTTNGFNSHSYNRHLYPRDDPCVLCRHCTWLLCYVRLVLLGFPSHEVGNLYSGGGSYVFRIFCTTPPLLLPRYSVLILHRTKLTNHRRYLLESITQTICKSIEITGYR
jgi:hypothetical protein